MESSCACASASVIVYSEMLVNTEARTELARAIGKHLVYFEWLDQHPVAYPTEQEAIGFEEEAISRLLHHPVFHAKVASLLNAIDFVLTDPTTVDQRIEDARQLMEARDQHLAVSNMVTAFLRKPWLSII